MVYSGRGRRWTWVFLKNIFIDDRLKNRAMISQRSQIMDMKNLPWVQLMGIFILRPLVSTRRPWCEYSLRSLVPYWQFIYPIKNLYHWGKWLSCSRKLWYQKSMALNTFKEHFWPPKVTTMTIIRAYTPIPLVTVQCDFLISWKMKYSIRVKRPFLFNICKL